MSGPAPVCRLNFAPLQPINPPTNHDQAPSFDVLMPNTLNGHGGLLADFPWAITTHSRSLLRYGARFDCVRGKAEPSRRGLSGHLTDGWPSWLDGGTTFIGRAENVPSKSVESAPF
jgi:hypothetical protein